MSVNKNKLVTINRKQYLSNRYIYEAMIRLKKTHWSDFEVEPIAKDKRNNIIMQVSSIIALANQATEKGYETPKLFNKVLTQGISDYISGNSQGIGWALEELRSEAIKKKKIIANPNKRVESTFLDGVQIDSIFNGFIDAIKLKSNVIQLEDMDNKYYRKRQVRIGYQYGFSIGTKRNKLVQNDFLEYFQDNMDIEITTVKKSLERLGLWNKVREIVKVSKTI
tara:strand:- start:18599 stop:19267 length:669 start_codon:yes stop_codon:yes gene_type:complete